MHNLRVNPDVEILDETVRSLITWKNSVAP